MGLDGYYKQELNTENPIGYGGKVAQAFGDLLNHLYKDLTSDIYAPRLFKNTVGIYNHAFSGYQQQDSQEFLAFLLDGLHEDLNRILKKPATEKPELKDKANVSESDIEALAEQSWTVHKYRNDSVILDLFGGLYKSTLVCPVCHMKSITFDPFMDLTLPLPSGEIWKKDFFVMPLVGSPKFVDVELPSSAGALDLKQYISKSMNLSPELLRFSEVFQGGFYRNVDKIDSVLELGDDIIAVYELEESYEEDNEEFPIPIYFENKGSNDSFISPVGFPIYVTIQNNETEDMSAVYRKVYEKLAQFNRQVMEEFEMDDLPFDLSKYTATITNDLPATESRILRSKCISLVHTPASPISNSNTSLTLEKNTQLNITDSKASLDENLDEADINQESSIIDDSEKVLEKSVEPATQESSQQNGASEIDMSDDDGGKFLDSPLDDNSAEVQNLGTSFGPDQEAFSDNSSMSGLPAYSDVAYVISKADTLICSMPSGMIDALFNEHQVTKIVDPEVLKRRAAREETNKSGIPLTACLKQFSQTEVLGENDLWNCTNCNEFRRASKTIELWRLPDILAIHLKRFSSYRGLNDKLEDLVNFPITGLEMKEFVCEKRKDINDDDLYDLFAVDNHFGGLGGGHYTAYARNFVNDEWYYFDDSRVTKADPKNAVSSAAYLLFYRRRTSSTPLGGPKMEEILNYVEKVRTPPPPPPLPPRNEPDNDEVFTMEMDTSKDSAFQGTGRILGPGNLRTDNYVTVLDSNSSETSLDKMPWGASSLNLNRSGSDIDENFDEDLELDKASRPSSVDSN